MGFTLLGILNSQAAGGGFTYWLGSYGLENDTSSRTGVTSLQVDSEDNIILVGDSRVDDPATRQALISKFTNLGVLIFEKYLLGADGFFRDLAISPSDNYFCASDPGAEITFTKYNSSGTIQLQRSLTTTDTGTSSLGIATNSDNDVYIASTSKIPTGRHACLAKFNSSGTIQWQRALGEAFGADTSFNSVATDSTGNIYAFGTTRIDSEGSADFFLAKYNSSGTIQWQRALGEFEFELAAEIKLDSSNNIYITGSTESEGAGSGDLFLAKYNSSGTLQWQRILGSSANERGASLVIDSLDDIYVAGQDFTNDKIILAKYNSSGAIQYQRKLGTLMDSVTSIALDSNEDLILTNSTKAFFSPAGPNIFIAKLPKDGSLIGTYSLDGVDVPYEASSLTAATSTLVASTSTIPEAATTFTVGTPAHTDGSVTLTLIVEGIE